jgi:hypothetical protein
MSPLAVDGTTIKQPSADSQPEMRKDLEVAGYLRMSVASVRRWRVLRQGPKYFKIGSAVRYMPPAG